MRLQLQTLFLLLQLSKNPLLYSSSFTISSNACNTRKCCYSATNVSPPPPSPTFLHMSSSSSSSSMTTWFIDGTNLQHQKSIPRSRTQIADNLLPLTQTSNIVLVFDNGREDAMEGSISTIAQHDNNDDDDDDGDKNQEEGGYFKTVITPSTQSADDYIVSEIQKMSSSSTLDQQSSSSTSGGKRRRNGGRYNLSKVNVVTADKGLRKLVLKEKRVVDVVVNPITFWKKYKSRLGGYKSTYENKPKGEEEEGDDE